MGQSGSSPVATVPGQRATIIYTMVECAKRHGHDPEVWLADVLERLTAIG